MILFIIIARPFLLFTGANNDTIDVSVTYLRIVMLSLPFNYIRLIICAAFRASGNTKISLISNVSANLVNLFLNYCLIMGNLGFPRLEVSGAAIATSIGNIVIYCISIAGGAVASYFFTIFCDKIRSKADES
jgi:Na+-driven multidrug efflux pump